MRPSPGPAVAVRAEPLDDPRRPPAPADPLLGLDERHRAAARKALAGLDRDVSLAFLSGSLPAGLGHAKSDLDVHVVLADDARLPRSTFYVDGFEVQFTVISRDVFTRTTELTAQLSATKSDRAQFNLNSYEVWQLMRTVTGQLLGGEESFVARFVGIDRTVARQVLMGNFAHPVGRAAEDAQGLIAVGDLDSAYVCAQVALRSAVEVALAGADELYLNEKFMLARLRRSHSRTTIDLLWTLLHTLTPPVPTVQAIEERLFLANGLVAHALLSAWDRPSAVEVDPLPSAAAVGPRRSPYWGLLRFSDCCALGGPDGSLRVGEEVAGLWAALDGREVPAVVRQLGQENRPDLVCDSIRRLVDVGAVREGQA